jgi:hypothetical protein
VSTNEKVEKVTLDRSTPRLEDDDEVGIRNQQAEPKQKGRPAAALRLL